MLIFVATSVFNKLDFTSIKDILKNEKSKVIIMEEGKPLYVLLPIEEYRELVVRNGKTLEKDALGGKRKYLWAEEEFEAENVYPRTENTTPFDSGDRETERHTSPIKLDDLPF